MQGNFDDGIVYLCRLTDMSTAGLMPVQKLVKFARHYFEERTISFRRQYAAKGVNEQIDMLIRIHYDPQARIGQYAVLGNGDQYRIENVSQTYDGRSQLRCTELTLNRLEDFYDIS